MMFFMTSSPSSTIFHMILQSRAIRHAQCRDADWTRMVAAPSKVGWHVPLSEQRMMRSLETSQRRACWSSFMWRSHLSIWWDEACHCHSWPIWSSAHIVYLMILIRASPNVVSGCCFAFKGSPILSTGRNEQDVGRPWVPKRITFDWIQRLSPSMSCSREQIWTWQRELIGHPSGPKLGTFFLYQTNPTGVTWCDPHRIIWSLTASKSTCFAVFSRGHVQHTASRAEVSEYLRTAQQQHRPQATEK